MIELEVIEFPQPSREMISQLIKRFANLKQKFKKPETAAVDPRCATLCTVCCNSGSYLLLSF